MKVNQKELREMWTDAQVAVTAAIALGNRTDEWDCFSRIEGLRTMLASLFERGIFMLNGNLPDAKKKNIRIRRGAVKSMRKCALEAYEAAKEAGAGPALQDLLVGCVTVLDNHLAPKDQPYTDD